MEYFHITASAAGSWAVCPGQAFLDNVNINTSGAASIVKIFNGTSSLGETVASIGALANGMCLQYGRLRMENGIFMTVSAGTPDITVSFE